MSNMPDKTERSDSTPSPRGGEATGAPRAPSRGFRTVINPEGRPSTTFAPAVEAPLSANSSIARLLFPPDDGLQPPPFDFDQGIQLGHFKVVERIRSGGMGAVFRAVDMRLNRVVALKVLPPAMSRDPSAVQRFRNEAQAAAQLDHDNIARVFYIGEDQGLNFIAFEFVTGTNIRDLMQQHGILQVDDSVNYTLQIASALLHTSAQGVVHRDIKPSNVIITPSGRAKLVDMGLARQEMRDEAGADLTLSGTTLGTFDYISPEQARDPRTADVRSDIYSLGCTLYHMLAGEPPYPQGTVLQKLLQHQGDDAPDPAQRNRRVPENLSAIVRKMMAKDPRRRYQTADQLVRDLMLVAGSMGLRSVSSEGLVWLSSQTVKLPFWERHMAWLTTVAALLLIVGYMEFGGLRFSPQGMQTPHSAVHPQTEPPATVALSNDRGDPLKPRPVQETERPARAPEQIQLASQTPPDTAEPVDDPDATAPLPPAPENPRATENSFGQEPAAPLLSLRSEFSGAVTLGPQLVGDGTQLRPFLLDPAATTGLGPAFVTPRSFDPSGLPVDIATRPASDPIASTETIAALPRTRPSGPSSSGSSDPLQGATASPTPTESTPAASAVREPEISIVGLDGTSRQSFPTLEAACSAAVDGTIIDLRYNGRRRGGLRESPLRITKKVTIRAGKGYRPTLDFGWAEIPAEGFQTRMISVTSGSLDLIGIDLRMTVDENVPAEVWSLCSVHRPDSLRFENVTVTVQNPRQRPAAVVEVRSSSLTSSMADMAMNRDQSRPPLFVEFLNCMIRGDTDLFLLKNLGSVRLSVRESAVAVQGTLLRSLGHVDTSADSAQIELRMEHLTAALGGGLIRLDNGDLPRKLLPVQVTASNCIFSTNSLEPLISMTGNMPIEDFRQLLLWNGQKNFYDRLQMFWSVIPIDGSGKTEHLDFAGWQKNWGPASEVDPRSESIYWQRTWANRPFSELTPQDFALDKQIATNPAVAAATNGTDAGANLESLLKLGLGSSSSSSDAAVPTGTP